MISLKPGITPLPIVLGYFIAAAMIAFLIIWRAKPKFSTIDLVHIGIRGAIVASADHILGDMIFFTERDLPTY